MSIRHPQTTGKSRPPDPTRFARLRALAEMEVVARIMANPAAGATVAAECGLSAMHFDEPDARLLFCAADVGREDRLDKLAVLRLASYALKADNLWDETQIAGNAGESMLYSYESLCRLAHSRPWCPGSVRKAAGVLLLIVGRQYAAGEAA